MAAVAFHRLAANELRAALSWYAARSTQAHDRFRQAIAIGIDSIAANPHAHATLFDERQFRLVRVRRFPYVLIYGVLSNEQAIIIAVAHTSRRPGYWKRRTGT